MEEGNIKNRFTMYILWHVLCNYCPLLFQNTIAALKRIEKNGKIIIFLCHPFAEQYGWSQAHFQDPLYVQYYYYYYLYYHYYYYYFQDHLYVQYVELNQFQNEFRELSNKFQENEKIIQVTFLS